MPTIIEMRLKANWAVRPDTRQLHGLACALFEQSGDSHTGQEKPFAVSPLQPSPGGSPDEWTCRAAWLPDSLPPAGALEADVIRVGHVSCAVAETTHRRVTHAALASSAPAREVTVSFGSPVFFSRNGTDIILPDPRLIAGSWRRRWNASLPDGGALAIGDGAWTQAHRLLGLDAFELRTSTRDSGHDRERTGFTGTATLRLAGNAPMAARQILGTLARFAEFCGTGAQTTHGFGVTALKAVA
jgi:CRISPR-associated endoribonuclease Cas6